MESDLTTALLLAVANKALVDYLAAPVRVKFPHFDMWWLVYVSLFTGSVVGWLSGVNVFTGHLEGVAGQVMTALLIGGGASLLHDIFDGKNGVASTTSLLGR